jgi:hypothetical protein
MPGRLCSAGSGAGYDDLVVRMVRLEPQQLARPDRSRHDTRFAKFRRLLPTTLKLPTPAASRSGPFVVVVWNDNAGTRPEGVEREVTTSVPGAVVNLDRGAGLVKASMQVSTVMIGQPGILIPELVMHAGTAGGQRRETTGVTRPQGVSRSRCCRLGRQQRTR